MKKNENQVYRPLSLLYKEDEEIDEILLSLLPMNICEIYAHFGIKGQRARKIRKIVRDRLNALEDGGKIFTTGRYSGLMYHKKNEDQGNF
jgi:hypothetical protein